MTGTRNKSNECDSRGSGDGMEDGFKACLVRSDAPHIDLPFHFLLAGQRDVEEKNPITRHLKFEVSLIATVSFFLRLGEYEPHSRMRHVRLNRNPSSRDRFARGIGQLETDCCRPHASRCRGYLVLNRHQGWGLDPTGTSSYQQSCRTGQSDEDSTLR